MKTAKVSNYKANVLNVNKELKIEAKSFNGACKILLALDAPNKSQKKLIRAILKDKVLYNIAIQNVRKSKAGNYSPFFVLQFLHKVEKLASEKKVSLTTENLSKNALLKVA